ncbi:hypothetical protein EXIGLDRAFT_768470 [Exidia glandulosa HHB12029]|uniref:VWFA domain-containing protein n=1 Tax=Exidia glandulosa HHB12029 TaxID=1314781 RepID=A0A165I834_EXIGL|nr:hypothetical protein EXIGLDRAFT_768470 [Exidia glandulosa HHB12029]
MTAWTTASDPPSYDGASSASVDTVAVRLATRALGDGSSQVLITLDPPVEPRGDVKGQRAAVDIVCVIDTSSSMSEPATLPAEPGTRAEVTELCILDVVKHALRVIIKSLNADDRIAIVTFSSRASIAADLTYMDDAGKRSVNSIMESLRPSGSTNLWDGLKTGMNILNPLARADLEASGALPRMTSRGQLPSYSEAQDRLRLASVFLLTDGVPNVTPPRGHIPMLQRYLAANPLLSLSINTFGFGYSLNSQLLYNIAEVGGGHYGFVPDLGMLGTIFVHALANTLATYAVQCAVEVEYDSTQLHVSALGQSALSVETGVREESRRDVVHVPVGESGYDATQSPETGIRPEPRRDVLRVPVGELQYGQTRDFVIFVRSQDGEPVMQDVELTVTATYQPLSRARAHGPLTSVFSLNATHGQALETPDTATIVSQSQRLAFASSVLDFFPRDITSDIHATSSVTSASPPAPRPDSAQYLAFYAIVQQMLAHQHPAAADADGQARMALQPAHWSRWGRHYLPSLARSHLRQRCGNFRDPGQLVYGMASPLFIRERDQADTAFDNLPPPRPGNYDDWRGNGTVPRGGVRSAGSSSSRTRVTTMSVWNTRVGPCFAGECLIRVAGPPSAIRVDHLRRDDLVSTPVGDRRVVAIVRTRVETPTEMCRIGDHLFITPWHPICLDGSWTFPADVSSPSNAQCAAVYSILLEPSSDAAAAAVWVGDVLCVTLGSGAVGDVRSHAFLSDYLTVARNLSTFPDWFTGDGVVECGGTARGSDGSICGFIPAGPPAVLPSTTISILV